MEIPTPPQAVAAFAAFVRERLADVSDSLAPIWNRRESAEVLPARGREPSDRSVIAATRQLAMVIMGAAAPFATTSYSRARLIRQMHASGLLSDEHVVHVSRILEIGPGDDAHGAPR